VIHLIDALVAGDLPHLASFLVLLAYVFWFAALIVILYCGHKQGGYGMPGGACVSMLSLSIMCLIGPTVEPKLFPTQPATSYYVLWLLYAIITALLTYQYARYAPVKLHVPAAAVAGVIGVWTFVVFYQDFYINMASPLAVLVMSGNFFYLLYSKTLSKGLSVVGAWCLFIGTTALYIGVLLSPLGGPNGPYPGHVETGYALVYYVYFVTIYLLLAYAIQLTKRRRAATADRAAMPGAAAEGS